VDCIARISEILMVSVFKKKAIELSFYLGDVDIKDFQNSGNTAHFCMVPLSINKANSSIELLNETIIQ
jgi:hypothetical protein